MGTVQAKKFVPPELPMVNFFGWTLGGFYLARYADSPVGAFDELVALAGLVWDPPASCAWAARVYVNNKEARNHGLGSVGLPSRLASFRTIPIEVGKLRKGSRKSLKPSITNGRTWWDAGRVCEDRKHYISDGDDGLYVQGLELCNVEKNGRNMVNRISKTIGSVGKGVGLISGRGAVQGSRSLASPVCTIEMPPEPRGWGPLIQLFLPNFSGATPAHPDLLKYSLRLLTTVRFVPPLKVIFPLDRASEDRGSMEIMDGVLKGRPLLCMAFDNMIMKVESPERWIPRAPRAARQRVLAI